jgi:hypothetical protein
MEDCRLLTLRFESDMRRCGRTKLEAGVTPTGEGGRDNGRCWCSPPPVLEANFYLFQSRACLHHIPLGSYVS